jgi:hypothetical protein
MQIAWGLLNTLQLISYALKFPLAIRDNLYLFFDIINDLLNMRAQIIQDWQDDILDSLITVSSINDTGEDHNIMKRAGTILLALIALFVMCIIALALSLLYRFVPMYWQFSHYTHIVSKQFMRH